MPRKQRGIDAGRMAEITRDRNNQNILALDNFSEVLV